MKRVPYWRTAHKRNSVRALLFGVVVSFVGGIWAALPGAYVDRLPTWVIFLASGLISAAGVAGAYISQGGIDD